MNKKIIILFSLVLLTFYIVSKVQAENSETMSEINLSNILLDNENKPSNALLDLLKEFNIEHDGTLKNIVDITQKQWLRASGKERWQIDEISVEKKDKILSILKDLKCIEEIQPRNKNYEYCILMGGLVRTSQLKLACILKLWKQGLRFKKLIFLGGERPRDLEKEKKELFLNDLPYQVKKDWIFEDNLPETENKINEFIFNQAELPEEFTKLVKVEFIEAPMIKQPNGVLTRPSTCDTIAQWLKTSPQAGTCLVISINPYIGYQDSVVKTFVPESFKVETVGITFGTNEKISVYLDNIARWLYQEKIRRKVE